MQASGIATHTGAMLLGEGEKWAAVIGAANISVD